MNFGDTLTFSGLVILAVGLSLVWLPLGIIFAGALLIVIAQGLPEKGGRDGAR